MHFLESHVKLVEAIFRCFEKLNVDPSNIFNCLRVSVMVYNAASEMSLTQTLIGLIMESNSNDRLNPTFSNITPERLVAVREKAIRCSLSICGASEMLKTGQVAEILNQTKEPKYSDFKSVNMQGLTAQFNDPGMTNSTFRREWLRCRSARIYDIARIHFAMGAEATPGDIIDVFESLTPAASKNAAAKVIKDRAKRNAHAPEITGFDGRMRTIKADMAASIYSERPGFPFLPTKLKKLSAEEMRDALYTHAMWKYCGMPGHAPGNGHANANANANANIIELFSIRSTFETSVDRAKDEIRAALKAHLRQKITNVERFVRRHFVLPDPGYYNFSDVLYRGLNQEERTTGWAEQLTGVSRNNSELLYIALRNALCNYNQDEMHEAWQTGAVLTPLQGVGIGAVTMQSLCTRRIYDKLSFINEFIVERYRKRLFAFANSDQVLNEDEKPQLIFPAGNFQLAKDIELKHPTLKKLLFIAQHELLYSCSELRIRRATKSLSKLVLDGDAILLTTTGQPPEPSYQRDSLGNIVRYKFKCIACGPAARCTHPHSVTHPHLPISLKSERVCHFWLHESSMHIEVGADRASFKSWLLVDRTKHGLRRAVHFEDVMKRTLMSGTDFADIQSVVCENVHGIRRTRVTLRATNQRQFGWNFGDDPIWPVTPAANQAPMEYVLFKRQE